MRRRTRVVSAHRRRSIDHRLVLAGREARGPDPRPPRAVASCASSARPRGAGSTLTDGHVDAAVGRIDPAAGTSACPRGDARRARTRRSGPARCPDTALARTSPGASIAARHESPSRQRRDRPTRAHRRGADHRVAPPAPRLRRENRSSTKTSVLGRDDRRPAARPDRRSASPTAPR